MIDQFQSLPKLRSGASQEIFFERGTYSSTNAGAIWQMWQKPTWAKMVHLMAIGSGSGGAGGASRASFGAAAAGGGGGACSAFQTLLIPALFLPKTCYILIGVAGGRVPAGSAGYNGNNTIISSIIRSTSGAAMILRANGGAQPSGAVIATTTGPGGIGPSIGNMSSTVVGASGHYNSTLGTTAGQDGAVGTTLSDVQPLQGNMLCGGAGGGGTGAGQNDFIAGGGIASLGIIPAIPGGAAGTGGNGQNGFWSWAPMCGTGGSGGGNNPTGTGGNGGDGAYGCGGGGGGQGVTGGSGGKGGGGLAIITCW